MRRALPLAAILLALAACAHPEDRRWSAMTTRAAVPVGEEPSVSVYAFAPPKAGSKTGVGDLSDRGQAALIGSFAATPGDAAALGKLLAAPLGGEGGGGAVDRTRLARTIVISVRKGVKSMPGDRLMSTEVEIAPLPGAGEAAPPFEFAGYTIVATDTKVQNIAKLQTESGASLTASLAPEIKGFGDNGIEGSLSTKRTSSADIVQQYENLGIDILPGRMVVTRESERGLDVVGNTLVALTFAAPSDGERTHAAFLATKAKLFENGAMLGGDKASVELQPLGFLSRCDMRVNVTLRYRLRRVVDGRRYYTEGKQRVEIVDGSTEPVPVTLVRASDVQGALYQILDAAGHAVLVAFDGTGTRRLVFDSYDDAKRMAAWLSVGTRSRIGATGPTVSMGSAPLPAGGTYRADFYSIGCPG